MKTIINFASLCVLWTCVVEAGASDTFIVKDGQPRAEIVIAQKRPRTTLLAAQELRQYVEKISGAKLSIATEPSGKVPVRIFVGRSWHTDKLGISKEELEQGDYRIVSGENWLVLIGDDTDFVPIEPWPRSNSDWVSGRVHAEWQRITGSNWGLPLSQMRKHYTGSTGTLGKPSHKRLGEDGTLHVWGFDERGSFNAVCGFLRGLGVRWYLPGELGEVAPRKASIPLAKLDETVRPDFPVLAVNIRFGVHGRETARWAMRLGVRNPYGLQTAHGLHHMTHNEQTLKNHPDWFALYGGRRHNRPGQRLNQLCYSNEELLGETVRFVRALFDHYEFEVVSVMPPDGYTAICQCELCEGKDTPERGFRGFYLPAYVPRVMGQSINATKGISKGEDIRLSVRQDLHEKAIGFNHFLVYFTTRMYWGGEEQDVVAMFDEYCRLFYGPAETLVSGRPGRLA